MDINLDVNLTTFIVQIVATIILILVVTIFFAKPMKKFLAARREFVEAELNNAQVVNDEASALKDAANVELAKIKAESGQMLEDANEKARIKYDAILSDAKIAADAELEKAKAKIERERQEMFYDARKEIEQQTATIASKIVQKEINASQHDDLFDDFVKLIGGGADE